MGHAGERRFVGIRFRKCHTPRQITESRTLTSVASSAGSKQVGRMTESSSVTTSRLAENGVYRTSFGIREEMSASSTRQSTSSRCHAGLVPTGRHSGLADRVSYARQLKRIRYVKGTEPGQYGEVGWRWEIFYRDEWRELPWHFDGPLCVTRDLVRQWYG